MIFQPFILSNVHNDSKHPAQSFSLLTALQHSCTLSCYFVVIEPSVISSPVFSPGHVLVCCSFGMLLTLNLYHCRQLV